MLPDERHITVENAARQIGVQPSALSTRWGLNPPRVLPGARCPAATGAVQHNEAAC
jgi:hypothetical protein